MVAKWRGVACPTCGALEGAKCQLVGEDESAYTEPHKSRIRLANGEPPPKRRVCDHMVYCPDCRHRPGEEEDGLDVEDDERHRHDIEVDGEPLSGADGGGHHHVADQGLGVERRGPSSR